MKYSYDGQRKRLIELAIVFVLLGGLLIGGGVFVSRKYYFDNLKPVSLSQKRVNIEIPIGSSLNEVAIILKKHGVIRNEWAFRQYVRNQGLQDKILAGTYSLRPSQDVKEIVVLITEGQIMKKLITILPGQRIDQIEEMFINSGFDPKATATALNPKTYAGHPALVDKPVDANLEGYLYPESFQRTSDTTPTQIVKASLDEMAKVLTPQLRDSFSKKGLSVHKAIILASIVEKEVDKYDDRTQVAQVFLSRLAKDMKLESDATARYGAAIAGEVPSVTYESVYNTYSNEGLPPSPISNVSEEALKAVGNPANTDWLYFVSGDDGITYFSKTLSEHEALTAQHCRKLCQL